MNFLGDRVVRRVNDHELFTMFGILGVVIMLHTHVGFLGKFSVLFKVRAPSSGSRRHKG